jgi:glycine/D-amino acid oxidase-like deaminating enzyme/nitrite reductase/ring-hydroxylating ferredoxin subunit
MNTDRYKYLNKSPESFWISTTSKTNYPILNSDLDVDIAIVGGGMTGLLCAYQLRLEGFNIVILEADRIITGTTAFSTAKITSQHDFIYDKLINSVGEELASQYATANEVAIKEIKKIVDGNNIECQFLEQEAFIYAQQDAYIKQIENEIKAASYLGIKASFVEEIPFPIKIKAGLKFENQAQFHPRKFLLSIAEILQKLNIQIYEQTRVVELEKHVMDSYILTTNNGNTVAAKKVIIASHYPFYNKHAMYYTRLYQERAYALAIKAEEKYPGGMYISVEQPTRSLRGTTNGDEEYILVVGENHKSGQGEPTNNHYKNLIEFADKVFTIKDIPYRWSTQDVMTMDSVPLIGNYSSDFNNLYIATGFKKWGMTSSMVSAMILRDLISKGKSPWQDVFDPSRRTIAASAKSFVKENVNVAGQLIDGKLENPSKKIRLKPGEGKIVKIDGDRSGVYKDENGDLHIVNTTCTHMGCELNWNEAEKSWDCPCHGSRFNIDGEILTGPAVHQLSKDKDVNIIKKLINEDF